MKRKTQINKEKVILIAHRGKGPTSKFTSPTEELWLKCKNKGLLTKQKTVPQKILESFNIKLPENTPPENTIAAFRQGLEEGADAIELDIFLSRDGIPMVIHDNELNRNVCGARRKIINLGIARDLVQGDDGYLGNVQDLDVLGLKNFDMGSKNCIPTLVEVIDFIVLFNKIRKLNKKDPIILNLEFKDKTNDNVTNTLKVVENAIKEGKILKNSVIYCSFDHDSLFKAIEIDSSAQIALALKTAFLFGENNVDIKNGWTVNTDKKYENSAMNVLEEKILKAYNMKSKVTALDAVLWDIEPELVDLAKKYELDLHASTSDFRDFTNVVFIGNLVKISQSVKVFFKTDEPKKINMILERAYKECKLDLSETKIIDFNDLTPLVGIDRSNKIDLKEVTVSEVKDFPLFLRQPKPNQKVHEKYQEESIQKLEDQQTLAEYIKKRCETNDKISILTKQIQEPPIENNLINIFDIMTKEELIKYWELDDIMGDVYQDSDL